MRVFIAFFDLVPVLLFLLSSISLQRDLYSKMSKGTFALFSSGTIMVTAAGIYKAIWKILYYLGVCDFVSLNKSFFPLQALGFLLAGISMIAMLTHNQGTTCYSFAIPVVFSGTMIFVTMMVFGLLGMNIVLVWVSLKMKKKGGAVLFILSFIFMLMMGYLASKDFSKEIMNLVAEVVNVAGQIIFLAATRILHKEGLATFSIEEAKRKNK